MGTWKRFQCKYCGMIVSRPFGVPIKTKCYRRKLGGLHVWVRCD